MSGCCKPGDFDGIFSERRARQDARDYERRGIGGQSRRLLEALRSRAKDRTVLEIGGGVGALHIELLRAGATRATNVELSRGYEGEARDLLVKTGMADRVERRVADFVREQAQIPDADVVVLDRVVCCYPDANALVTAAARHAREVLALTLPMERWYMRVGRALINLWPRLSGSRFRFFVHPTRVVREAAEREGLRQVTRSAGLVWQLLQFERV